MRIYTIKGYYPDQYGNFTLTAEMLGLANAVHDHPIADVTNLQTLLDGKAAAGHTHVAMSAIRCGGSDLTGQITLAGSGLNLAVDGQAITLAAPLDITVDLDAAPALVNGAGGRAVYWFAGDWATLGTVRKGKGYSVAGVTDENALLAFTGGIARPIVDVFIYRDGIRSDVVRVQADDDTQVYPPAAYDRLSMSSSLDGVSGERAVEGEQYPAKIVPVDENSFTVTVTPYPPAGCWTLECDLFDLPATVYTGTQTVTINLPADLGVGAHLGHLYARPVTPDQSTVWGYGDAAAKLTFYRVVRAASALQPAYHWPLNNSAEEIVHHLAGANAVEGEAIDYSLDGVRGASYQTKLYTTDPGKKGIWTDGVEIDPSAGGFSLSFFVKTASAGRNNSTKVRWYDGTTATTCLGLSLSYQAVCLYWMNTSPTYTGDWATQNAWSHLCLTVTPPLTEADGLTAAELNNAWYFDTQLYINGVAKQTSRVLVYKSHASRLTNIGGADHSFGIGMHDNKTQDNVLIDEVKIFDRPLTLAEVQSEASLAGYVFEDDPGGGETTPKPPQLNDSPRAREGKPADIAAVPLTADLKVFVIDKNTVAVGGNYEDFYNARLRAEYTGTLPAMEQNFRNGYKAEYLHDFYYRYSMIELQADYEPRILDNYDADDYFQIDNQATTWLGSWSSASGAWEVPDVYDQTRRYRIEAANITHFAYLRLPFDMVDGTGYTISDGDGNTVTFVAGQATPSRAIKVNQEGYPADSAAKVAYLGAWLGSYGTYQVGAAGFAVVNAAGETVHTGTPVLRDVEDSGYTLGATRKISGEIVYEMDFSALTTEGTYRIHVPGVGWSWPFSIGRKVAEKLFFIHARGLYHQRSGIAKAAPHTGWPMAKSHDITYEAPFPGDYKNLEAFKDSAGNWASLSAFNIIRYQWRNVPHRDVYGGWWDAADWDRRDMHMGGVRSLAGAYLMYPDKFTDNQLNLPESGNGIPDILSEAMWGCDVWRRTQRAHGGISGWIECSRHPTQADAAAEMEPFCMSEPTACSSLHYALTAAQLSRALKLAGAVKQADLYADSAIRAFDWGIDNLAHFEVSLGGQTYTFDEPENYNPDRGWLTYRMQYQFWAAGQLYLLTGDAKYLTYMTGEAWAEYQRLFDIDDAFFRNVFWELAELDALPAYRDYMRNWIIAKADYWISAQAQFAYRDVTFPPGNYYTAAVAWGNCHPGCRGQLWAAAYYLTGEEKYKTAIQHSVNNLTGANALGRAMTTGVGKVSPCRFLSKIDELNRANGTFDPVPGITAYTFGNNGLASSAVGYVWMLNKSARGDANFSAVNKSLMPGRLRSTVSPNAGAIAVYLQNNLPLWRSHVPIQDYAVDQNEFTVWETVSINTLLLAPLLADNWTPEASWSARTPVTDPKELEGYVFLP
ncbi:glycoside hydrolase family 9 protein [Victivallis sp. Marseille-Q1083]|uniref:glycoside hydrolase family 9 protein n=1 Tax=Victivallis sp. Marseille-Q1083 TaxID=2717288 RepID=UPI00158B1412|nr:glycoside hydrolase family 9 protein [Victivallis sp. Marseille-Q1083]